MRAMRWVCVALLARTLVAQAIDTGIDPAHMDAWGENVGWVNAGPTNDEITVHFDGNTGWLSGYAWGENVGWIVLGNANGGPYANTTSNNWGVNLAANGHLSGYAWGENVGWLNFNDASCDAAIDTANGEFSGHAWGENIGWLKFKGSSPDYGVRTIAFDTQPYGTPNWWLDHHGVIEGYNAGDGVPAWQKYVMDTDPNVEGDYLRITAVTNVSPGKAVVFTPASTKRYYTLFRRDELTRGGWSNVPGQVSVQYGTPGEKSMQDTNTAAKMFYGVNVRVTP